MTDSICLLSKQRNKSRLLNKFEESTVPRNNYILVVAQNPEGVGPSIFKSFDLFGHIPVMVF